MNRKLQTFSDSLRQLFSRPHSWEEFSLMLLCLVGLFCSLGLMAEDYMTSYMGYRLFPTQKALPWVMYIVAALPSLVSMIFIMKWRMDGAPIDLFLGIVGLSADMISDWMYKTVGMDMAIPGNIAYAVIDTVGIYTLLSEVLFTTCLSTIMLLWQRFFATRAAYIEDKAAYERVANRTQQGQQSQQRGGGADHRQPQQAQMPMPAARVMQAADNTVNRVGG